MDLHWCDLESLAGLPAELGASPWGSYTNNGDSSSSGGGSSDDGVSWRGVGCDYRLINYSCFCGRRMALTQRAHEIDALKTTEKQIKYWSAFDAPGIGRSAVKRPQRSGCALVTDTRISKPQRLHASTLHIAPHIYLQDDDDSWQCICVFLDASLNRLRGFDVVIDQPSLHEVVSLEMSIYGFSFTVFGNFGTGRCHRAICGGNCLRRKL